VICDGASDRSIKLDLGADAQRGASAAIVTVRDGERVAGKDVTVLVLEASRSQPGRGDRFGIEGSG